MGLGWRVRQCAGGRVRSAVYWRKRLEGDEAKRAWLVERREAHAKDGFRLVDANTRHAELPPPPDEH
jgi:hypothetical protein